MSRTKLTGSQITTLPNTPRKDNVTNNSVIAPRIETGWGFILGAGSSVASKAVTFQTAFSAAPIIYVSCIGYKDTTDPTTITDFGNWEIPNVNACALSVSGFTAIAGTIDASTIATTRRVGFSWIAIGV